MPKRKNKPVVNEDEIRQALALADYIGMKFAELSPEMAGVILARLLARYVCYWPKEHRDTVFDAFADTVHKLMNDLGKNIDVYGRRTDN